LARDIPGQK